MLAYRHAFHAGNHADVLKHWVLTQVLRYMTSIKEKSFRFIDTHAGSGAYALESYEAQKRSEYRSGIMRLCQALNPPPSIIDYLDVVQQFNAHSQSAGATPDLAVYPGSPEIGRMLLRPQDELRFFELHPTDYRLLCARFEKSKATQIFHQDGFTQSKSQFPPPSRRGVTLIDPSYELSSDYDQVLKCLKEAFIRFQSGTYMVWYPQVIRLEAQELPRRLKGCAAKSWLHARITIQRPNPDGFGLIGSGVFIFNPPYRLANTLRQDLPWLTDTLAQYDGAHFLLEEEIL